MMTKENYFLDLAEEYKNKNTLKGKIVEVSVKETLRGCDLSITYKNAWWENRTIIFHVSTTGTLFATRIQEHPLKKGISCDNVNISIREGTGLFVVRMWIDKYLKKMMRGTDREVVAFNFFKKLSKDSGKIGWPKRSTQKEDRADGIDLYIPVKSRQGPEWVDAPIDIKSDKFYQDITAKKNKKKGRKVSTLCFGSRKDLEARSRVIIKILLNQVEKGEIFNLNIKGVAER